MNERDELKSSESSEGVGWQRNWRLLLPIFLCFLVLFIWRLRPGPPQYIAVATILVPQTVSDGVLDGSGLTGQPAQSVMLDDVRTHVALLSSEALLTRASNNLSQSLLDRGWPDRHSRESSITARSPDSHSLVEVAVEANDAASATSLVRALIQVYTERLGELNASERRKAQQSLMRQLMGVRSLLRTGKTTASKGSSTHEQSQRWETLRDMELDLMIRSLPLSTASLSASASAPSVLDITTKPDPTARTWPRVILTSFVCALLLVLLSALWLEQMRGS